MSATNNIPLPTGAVQVFPWQPLDGYRFFAGTSRVISREAHAPEVRVGIDGEQHTDGRVTRHVTCGPLDTDDSLTPLRTRQIAAALLATADEIDRWAVR